jgi:hypothetical protein
MEYGLDINGNPWAAAIAITSWGGFFFLTKTTAPTPAIMAVRMTWIVVKPVNKTQSSESAAAGTTSLDHFIQLVFSDEESRIQRINNLGQFHLPIPPFHSVLSDSLCCKKLPNKRNPLIEETSQIMQTKEV